MEQGGIPWNKMEFRGTIWNFLERDGTDLREGTARAMVGQNGANTGDEKNFVSRYSEVQRGFCEVFRGTRRHEVNIPEA